MFAGGLYPASDDYSEMMKVEFEQQVKRLRTHPAIVLYCGNNEIQEGIDRWGWKSGKNDGLIWYDKIFKDLIPKAVSTFDKSNVSYLESSPLISWSNASSLAQGDVHLWAVWHAQAPIESLGYMVPRFNTEFGLPSTPTIQTIKNFTNPEDRAIDSPIMLAHQKLNRNWIRFNKYLEDYYSRQSFYTNFELYIYASQLVQALGLQTAIEAARRSQPTCMGVLYWQFNDCWSVTSWSSIDYFDTWKAGQYRAKKYYENVILSTHENNHEELEIYLICDSGEFFGVLDIELYSMDGSLHWRKRTGLKIHCPTSSLVYKLKPPALYEKIGNKSQVVFRTSIRHYMKTKSDIEGIRFDHFHYFVRPKVLELKEPILSLSIDRSSKELVLKAENIVKDIMLFIEDGVLELEENYFDMAPGEKRIKFKEESFQKIAGNATKIKYFTLWDSHMNTTP